MEHLMVILNKLFLCGGNVSKQTCHVLFITSSIHTDLMIMSDPLLPLLPPPNSSYPFLLTPQRSNWSIRSRSDLHSHYKSTSQKQDLISSARLNLDTKHTVSLHLDFSGWIGHTIVQSHATEPT